MKSKRVVVDSCVAAKWFFNEEHSLKAHSLLGAGLHLVAPDFALVELANVVWKTHKRRLITLESALSRVEDAPRFFSQLIRTEELLSDALVLGALIDVPVYDCAYVVVARALDAPLVTADSKLLAKLSGTPDAANVVHLADWK